MKKEGQTAIPPERRGNPAIDAQRIRAVWEWQNLWVELWNKMVEHTRTTPRNKRDPNIMSQGVKAGWTLGILLDMFFHRRYK